MSAPSREDEDMEMLNFTVRVPRHLPLGIMELLEKGFTKAAQILARSAALQDLVESSDSVAQLVISQARPGGLMLEDRIGQMATIKEVLEEGDWLTGEDINKLQKKPSAKKSLPANDWKRRGRVFSVLYGGKEYFPRYQFDSVCQPLPSIINISNAYGECADTWPLAIWFHFPNGWLAKQVGNEAEPVAPRDALYRPSDVIKAARNRNGTYVA